MKVKPCLFLSALLCYATLIFINNYKALRLTDNVYTTAKDNSFMKQMAHDGIIVVDPIRTEPVILPSFQNPLL